MEQRLALEREATRRHLGHHEPPELTSELLFGRAIWLAIVVERVLM